MPRKSRSQGVGDRFERILFNLLERFLKETGFEIVKKRRQKSGQQFGRDLHFKCKDKTDIEYSWFFECKHYDSPPDTDHVLGKLAQARASSHRIDCWVLVSPHHDVSNEVDELLERERKACSFDIVTWSPETGVRDIFALYPDLYKKVYGESIRLHRTKRLQILKKWKQEICKLSHHRQAIRDYCRTVIAENEYMDFRGILQVREILKLRVEDLYVPLWATGKPLEQSPASEELGRRANQPIGQSQSSSSDRRFTYGIRRQLDEPEQIAGSRIEIARTLQQHQRFVILGDPGSGKSTLLKLLALSFARGRAYVEARFRLSEDRLPVLVPIAAYGAAVAETKTLGFDKFLFDYLAACRS
jgi:hypothetical protein